MDVVLTVVWVVVVDDELNVVHVESSGRNVCGDKDGRLASPELIYILIFIIFTKGYAFTYTAIDPKSTGGIYSLI